MSRMHSSGKDTDPAVPYQSVSSGSKVLPPSEDARQFSQEFNEKYRLTLRNLAKGGEDDGQT